ncbi:hypothetical protein GCM10029992_37810 [Glycomyces albus]
MDRRAPVSGRPGRLVYDAVWLTGYDDMWKPPVDNRAAGMGIGAVLLVELLDSRHLAVAASEDDHLVVFGPGARQPLFDSLALWLFEQIRAEPVPLPPRTWLQFLAAEDVVARVVDRMITAGLMLQDQEPVRSRWRRRTVVAYRPADMLAATAPFHRLRLFLRDPAASLELTDVFLLGLTETVGLHRHLHRHHSADARHRSQAVQQRLPTHLRIVLAHLGEAIGATATTRGPL